MILNSRSHTNTDPQELDFFSCLKPESKYKPHKEREFGFPRSWASGLEDGDPGHLETQASRALLWLQCAAPRDFPSKEPGEETEEEPSGPRGVEDTELRVHRTM